MNSITGLREAKFRLFALTQLFSIKQEAKAFEESSGPWEGQRGGLTAQSS